MLIKKGWLFGRSMNGGGSCCLCRNQTPWEALKRHMLYRMFLWLWFSSGYLLRCLSDFCVLLLSIKLWVFFLGRGGCIPLGSGCKGTCVLHFNSKMGPQVVDVSLMPSVRASRIVLMLLLWDFNPMPLAWTGALLIIAIPLCFTHAFIMVAYVY